MEVAGPLGTPLGLAQRKRASPRGEAGTSICPLGSSIGLLHPQAVLIKVELDLTADKFNFVIVTKEDM